MNDSNHSTDIGTIAYLHGVESGKAYERAKIVAWLEWNDYGHFGMLAKSIKAGEHLK